MYAASFGQLTLLIAQFDGEIYNR
uniref:Uncharacterized protein n=1 Tax=Arundo donax TaxID=35708 RepID=A0A0A9HUU5_ARUDO